MASQPPSAFQPLLPDTQLPRPCRPAPPAAASGEPWGLYVHIPFCVRKCGYCDFNSHEKKEHLIPAYVRALRREAEVRAAGLAGRIPAADTVFFGGGTPTTVPAEDLCGILAELKRLFPVSPDAEISIEANPGTVDAEKFAALRRGGFNRLSLGVQSLRDADLGFLERIHSGPDALRACGAARDAGFENVNTDLMFALPSQTLDDWEGILARILDWGPDHVSAYCLTIEEGTRFAGYARRGRWTPLDMEKQGEFLRETRRRLAERGYAAYEISNFSRPGRECRHNLKYWRNTPWLGLGAGAHAFDGRFRWGNVRPPERYIRLVSEKGTAEDFREEPTPAQRRLEDLFCALRLTEGLARKEFARRHGTDPVSLLAEPLARQSRLGLMVLEPDRIAFTEAGVLLADSVLEELVAALPEVVRP